ncbi:MAG: amidohydrolase family protein [Solirubrobacteraceae bacterium]
MPGVDFHTHLAPLLDDQRLVEAGLSRDDGGRIAVAGSGVGPHRLYQPAALVAHLRERRLDAATVSPPPPFFRQDLDPERASAWAAALNDGVLAAVVDHPQLLPLGYLPLEHPELALAEHRRLAQQTPWAGRCASAGGASRSLADPDFEPLWAELHGSESLLLLHPGSSPDGRLQELYLHNLLGNPVETAIAAAQLVFADVLARYPRIRVLLVHCGGCLPSLVGRFDHGVATERPGLRPLSQLPSQAVKAFWVDCLVHDPDALDHAVEVFGEHHVLLGSDWPFPMGVENPVALIAHRGQRFVEQVSVENAAAALGSKAPRQD